eukprot:2922922-Amphidinium_carterae.1
MMGMGAMPGSVPQPPLAQVPPTLPCSMSSVMQQSVAPAIPKTMAACAQAGCVAGQQMNFATAGQQMNFVAPAAMPPTGFTAPCGQQMSFVAPAAMPPTGFTAPAGWEAQTCG